MVKDRVREMVVKYVGRPRNSEKMDQSEKAAKFTRRILADETQEVMLVVLLDNKNVCLGWCEISRGTLTEALVHPREVFKSAILANAAGIILAHNHPSGNVSPSAQDVESTKRMSKAGALLGVEVIDHIIVSASLAFYSFRAGMPNALENTYE